MCVSKPDSKKIKRRVLPFWDLGMRKQANTKYRRYVVCKIPGADIKQLLDEVEHDIMNYQNRGLCYLPKPKAEADNTDTRF